MKRGRLHVFPFLLIFALLLGLFTACTSAETQAEQAHFQNLDGRFTSRKITDESTALAAVGDAAESLGIADVQTELADCTRSEALDSTFYRFAQTYQGIPVYGRSVVVSADASGNAELLTGNYAPIEEASVIPTVSKQKLALAIQKFVNEKNEQAEFRVGEIDSDDLCVYSDGETAALVYRVVVEIAGSGEYELLLDANNAKVHKESALIFCDYALDGEGEMVHAEGEGELVTKQLDVYRSGEQYFFADTKRNIELYRMRNDAYWFVLEKYAGELDEITAPAGEKITEHPVEVDALAHVQVSYDYFASQFEHQGPDGEGKAKLYIFTDYALPANGKISDAGYNNANSNSDLENKVACIWVGQKILLREATCAASLDTMTHEYSHAVIKFACNLNSSGQAGALHEGVSDIFGELAEEWSTGTCDWMHGDRSLKDPKENGYPAKVTDRRPTDADYVHGYATVVSHAAYLMVEGDGSGTALDTLTLARLLYKTLFTLPSDCTFAQFRRLAENMAVLMNLSEGQRTRISWAFDQVGIYPQSVCYTIAPDCEITVLDAVGEVYENYSAFYVNYPSDENSTVHALKHESGAALKLNVKSGEYYLRLADNATVGTYSCRVKIDGKDGKKTLSLYTPFGDRKNAAADGLVTDALHEERPTGEGMTAVFALPQINLDSEDVRSFNQRVMDVWYADIKGTLEGVDDGEELTFWSVTYEWYVNGDVLSLLIKDDYEGGCYWDVNNFSVSTGAYLTTQEVYACAETENWKETLRPAVAAAYCESGAVSKYTSLNGRDEAFRSGLSLTISEETLAQAVPYFDENGELCVHAIIYLPEPGGAVDILVNIERYEPTEDILSLIGGKSGGESTLALLYREVLRDYAEMGKYKYVLYDIDKDGTPELILREYGVRHEVYTVRGGIAVFCGYLSCYDNGLYQYDGNGIITHDGGQGREMVQYLDLYTIENGELDYDSQLIGTEENTLEELMQMLETLTPIGDFLPVIDESYLQ